MTAEPTESVYPITADDGADTLPMAVFHRGDKPAVEVVPATRWRDWMNATTERVANRCLPLLMANQNGWMLLNPAPFKATWEGGDGTDTMTVEYPADVPEDKRIAKSHFGFGIVTFSWRDVICTPPGWNTVARGPTNWPKDGVAPLDGLIETDWSVSPFTMNWKMTRPGTVEFEQDEPFCQIFPQRRGELESFRPEYRTLRGQGDLARRISAWSTTRLLVQIGKDSTKAAGNEKWRRIWLEDYFRGTSPTGHSSDEHQTTLRLAPFERGGE